MMDLALEITPSMPVMAADVSSAVGLIFGVYLVMRVDSPHPIEALRYE